MKNFRHNFTNIEQMGTGADAGKAIMGSAVLRPLPIKISFIKNFSFSPKIKF